MNKSRSQQHQPPPPPPQHHDDTLVVLTASGATSRQRLVNQPKSASLGYSTGQRRPAAPVSAVSFEGRRYRDASPGRENNNGLVASKVSPVPQFKTLFSVPPRALRGHR